MSNEPEVTVVARNRKGVGDRRDVAEILNEDGDRLMHWCLRHKVSKSAIAIALRTGMSYEDIIQTAKLRLLNLKTVLAHFKQSTLLCSAVRWTVYRICENSRQKRKLPSLEFIGRGDFSLPDTSEPTESFVSEWLMHDSVRDVISRLHQRDRNVLEMRFGLRDGKEMTLSEIGNAMGITRERVRQIERRALERLRHPSIIGRLADISA